MKKVTFSIKKTPKNQTSLILDHSVSRRLFESNKKSKFN